MKVLLLIFLVCSLIACLTDVNVSCLQPDRQTFLDAQTCVVIS